MRRCAALLALLLVVTPSSLEAQQPATFAQLARVSASWTSATSVNTAAQVAVANFTTVLVTYTSTNALNGTVVFEADDGSGTWYSIVANRASTGRDITVFDLSTASSESFDIDVSGWTNFRVRLATAITPTGVTATFNLITTAAPTNTTSEVILADAAQAFAQSVGSDGAAKVNCVNCGTSLTLNSNGIKLPVLGLRLFGKLGQPLGDKTPLATTVTNLDPCVDVTAAGSVAISQTANAQIIAGQPGRRILICRYGLVGSDAESVSIVEGSGSTCATGTAAVIGAATAASGMSFAANGGISEGAGSTWLAVTKVPGDSLCVFQSGSGTVAGSLKYAFTF